MNALLRFILVAASWCPCSEFMEFAGPTARPKRAFLGSRDLLLLATLLVAFAAMGAPSLADCTHRDAMINHQTFPETPDDLRGASVISDVVVVSVRLSADGAVQRAEVKKSSGNARIDNLALAAARSASYAPAMDNCVPVSAEYNFVALFNGLNVTTSLPTISGPSESSVVKPEGGFMAACDEAWLAQDWPAAAIRCDSAATSFAADMDELENRISSQQAALSGPDAVAAQIVSGIHSPNLEALMGSGVAETSVAWTSGFALARSAFAYNMLHRRQRADAQRSRAASLILRAKPATYDAQKNALNAAGLLRWLRSSRFYIDPRPLD